MKDRTGYKTMWKLLNRAGKPKLILATALALSGCATSSAVIDTSCTLFSPITFSSKDTPETRQQVERHNSKWVCRCRKDCP